MMYPRLKLARNLLRKDGVLLASIDDGEVHHLIDLLSDIFGEECFVATLVWEKKKKGAFLSGAITNIKEYVVAYARDAAAFEGLIGEIARQMETYPVIKTTNTRGRRTIRKGIASKFRLDTHHVSKGARISSGNMEMILHSDMNISNGVLTEDVDVESNWIYSQSLLDQYADAGELYVTQDLYFRRIVTEPRVKKLKDVLPMEGASGETGFKFKLADNLFEDGWGTNEDGFDELHELYNAQSVMSFPKPSKLISKLALAATRDDKAAVVLDFFAGSGTTTHGVWALNAQDGGHRKIISVQLPEPLDVANEDQRAAAEFCDRLDKPRNIAELTKERLRRAAKKIKEENPGFTGDLGFRVFKLASSNIRTWEPDRDSLAETLEASVEHLKTDRTEQDILFELLLKLGLDLCVPIDVKSIKGHAVHSIGGGSLLVCLSPTIPQADVEPLALGLVAWHQALKPAGETTVVFRDSAFADDVAKTNLTAILQQHGLETVREPVDANAMKLHFEPNLDYQLQAIEAVCGPLPRAGDLPDGVHRHAGRRQRANVVARERSWHRQPADAARRRTAGQPARHPAPPRPRTLGFARVRRLHRGDGDRHRQDLRLSAHRLRAEQALRLHQVRDRGALGGDQGRRLSHDRDRSGTPQGALRGRALRLLHLRLGEARPGAQLRHQPADPDHGDDGRCHQQVRRRAAGADRRKRTKPPAARSRRT